MVVMSLTPGDKMENSYVGGMRLLEWAENTYICKAVLCWPGTEGAQQLFLSLWAPATRPLLCLEQLSLPPRVSTGGRRARGRTSPRECRRPPWLSPAVPTAFKCSLPRSHLSLLRLRRASGNVGPGARWTEETLGLNCNSASRSLSFLL